MTTLSEFAYDQARLEVACSRCDRRGRYRVANLIAIYGPNMQLVQLASTLSKSCPNKQSVWVSERCSVYFPQYQPEKDV